MKSLKSFGLAMLLAIATAGAAPAYGQQPSAGATLGPNWCRNVPETPAPPKWKPEDWANTFKYCSSLNPANFASGEVYHDEFVGCRHACEGAQDAWATYKNPPHQNLYQSTTEPQGPMQLPGGTTGYILPLLPIPSPSASPAAGAPQGSADPGGSFAGGYFPGADLNAINTPPQPPDVAADVSPTQNVEFVKNLGLYIWNKPTLPIASPAPTPAQTLSMANFWCNSFGIRGQQQSQCTNGIPHAGYALTDPQIGYDASLGRWIATTLDYWVTGPRTGSDYVYIAVSSSGTALGSPLFWTRWSVPVCISDPSHPYADQPLLGWSGSGGFVGVDVLCFGNLPGDRGADSLIVVPNSNLAPTPATSLPNPIVPPCIGMTPARD